MIVCVGCKEISYSLFGKPHCLCDDCMAEIDELYDPCYMEWHRAGQNKSKPLATGLALYKYQGLVRDLIIEAKAGKSSFSLRTLMYLWRSSVDISNWLSSCDHLTPVNSSLASRLRGGFDIAYHLASSGNVKVKRAPFRGRFRLRKQSFVASSIRKQAACQFVLQTYTMDVMDDSDQADRAIVDDIITSGQSIFKTITDLNPDPYKQIRIAALAYALSQDKTSV